MKIKQIAIENFRGIKKLENFQLENLSLLVGENGTSKTSILEAINFCLSPYFLSGRIKHTDFHKGEDIKIKIILEFDENFKVLLPDGYTKQEIECNRVCLEVKKRDRATPKKAFSDIVVGSHYVLPVNESKTITQNGVEKEYWEKERKGHKPEKPSIFTFDKRLLTFPLESEGLPKSFYFPKNREKQLYKGFNSSISSVFDDFNWRFNKEVRKIETAEDFNGEKFITQKNNFETSILEKIDEKSQQKTFQKLNEKLEKVGLPKADLSLIDCNAPFDSAFLSQKLESLDLPISQLGSGVEMVVSLLFLETMAEISKENILILIDEPELHLHPDLQNNFIDHIVSISEKNQFLFSTHSPLFVKQTLNNDNVKIQIHCLEKENEEVKILELEKRVLPYVSANEVNFIAFGLATEEYYDELYNEIEINFWNDPDNDFKTLKQNESYDKNDCRQIIFDNEFFSKLKKETVNSPFRTTQNKVTIHTHIRNKIHHPKENGGSPTPQELKQSIEKMRGFF
ncbi:ATP-binding protein [bacterium]|nr:ATP-binding protein [bacterium]